MDSESLQRLLPAAVFLAVILVLFWVMVVRPQARASREHRDLVDSLRVGDRIRTAGGLHGAVRALDKQTMTLEVAPGVQVVFDRRAARARLE